MFGYLANAKNKAVGFVKGHEKQVIAASAAVAVVAAPVTSALATPPSYIVDIGINPDDVITDLVAVLSPYLVAAITVGLGFFAVRTGYRWIKSLARG